MAVSDLTGTTWVINEEPSVGVNFSYNINFTAVFSVETNFNIFEVNNSVSRPIRGLRYHDPASGYVTVYQTINNTWASESVRTISITGGTDVANTNLITWLEANATQVLPEAYIKGIKIGNTTYPIAVSKLLSSDTEYNLEVKPLSLGGNTYGIVSAQEPPLTDLTGTSWLMNESIVIDFSYIYYINGTCYFEDEMGIYNGPIDKLIFEFVEKGLKQIKVSYENYDYTIYSSAWQGVGAPTLSFTSGTDVTNLDLITWIQTNATRIS